MALIDNNGARGCGKAFQAFAANLETLNEALYSGMTIDFSSIWDCRGTGALEPTAIHESILARMRGTFKRLSIRLYAQDVCWNKARDCSNFILLQLLLRDFIGDMESSYSECGIPRLILPMWDSPFDFANVGFPV